MENKILLEKLTKDISLIKEILTASVVTDEKTGIKTYYNNNNQVLMKKNIYNYIEDNNSVLQRIEQNLENNNFNIITENDEVNISDVIFNDFEKSKIQYWNINNIAMSFLIKKGLEQIKVNKNTLEYYNNNKDLLIHICNNFSFKLLPLTNDTYITKYKDTKILLGSNDYGYDLIDIENGYINDINEYHQDKESTHKEMVDYRHNELIITSVDDFDNIKNNINGLYIKSINNKSITIIVLMKKNRTFKSLYELFSEITNIYFFKHFKNINELTEYYESLEYEKVNLIYCKWQKSQLLENCNTHKDSVLLSLLLEEVSIYETINQTEYVDIILPIIVRCFNKVKMVDYLKMYQHINCFHNENDIEIISTFKEQKNYVNKLANYLIERSAKFISCTEAIG